MKKIYVSGWWGENFGDDLFLKVLLERYPDVKFYSHSGQNGVEQFKAYENIKLINTDKRCIRLANNFFRKMKLPYIQNLLPIILGNYIELGGSIFLEEDNWLSKANKRIKLSNLVNNYFIIGSNFGPSENKEFIQTYKKLYANINSVRFRDQASKRHFDEMHNVRVSPDVVFNLDVSPYKKIVNQKKIVNISVISVERMYRYKKNIPKEYYDKIAEICRRYVEMGYFIVLMAYSEISNDREAAEFIIERLPSNIAKKVNIYTHKSVNETLKQIAEAEIIIPSRFHGMVVGWLFEKKMHVLSYSQKTNNTLKYIDGNFPITNIEELKDKKIEDIINNVSTIRSDILENVILESANQFKELDNFIKGNTNE